MCLLKHIVILNLNDEHWTYINTDLINNYTVCFINTIKSNSYRPYRIKCSEQQTKKYIYYPEDMLSSNYYNLFQLHHIDDKKEKRTICSSNSVRFWFTNNLEADICWSETSFQSREYNHKCRLLTPEICMWTIQCEFNCIRFDCVCASTQSTICNYFF